jgi:type IV pilus assembly protein PilY1
MYPRRFLQRFPRPPGLLVAAFAAAGVLGLSGLARAQTDVNPPLPNVMLLVDTSGSMEYKSSSSDYPTCDPTGATPSEKSRWIDLLSVLTGSIQDYRCYSEDRSSLAFKQEYSLGSTLPYDLDYMNPYHRPLSGTCTPGPGVLPSPNAYTFPSGAIHYHPYDNPTGSCSNFSQASDGLLDSFQTRVRFGLMTFDTLPDPGTGVSGTSPDYLSGVRGTWSYFVGQPHQGKPTGCGTLSNQEVGARNAAAPPWEGRMVAFGDPNASGGAITTRNEQIQQILLASRPYGATPIAGMLDDARDFFWNDHSKDPVDTSKDFGPYNDPYVAGGCRKNFVVLLSDGEPNMDLRPFCDASGSPAGQCPYKDKPEEVSADLANAALHKPIDTFVIGFAVSKVTVGGSATPVDCKKLTQADLDPSQSSGSLCSQYPDNSALQACCTLSRIAYNGGTDHAYFADNLDELRLAMSAVLSQIATSTTSRTLPVFAANSNVRDAFAGSYRFYSSFQPQAFDLWTGVLERQRYVCQKDTGTGQINPVAQTIDPSKGDDFVANVNSAPKSRALYTVIADANAGARYSQHSIRPELTSDPDGMGQYSGVTIGKDAPLAFDNDVPPAAMSIDSTTCAGMTATQCRDKYMKWEVGLDNGTSYTRCKNVGTSDCNVVGDIYHSTPRLVGRPGEFLRDESYQVFAQGQATRPLVLYTSTNDGFLHAFKVAPGDSKDTDKVDKKENNELWAFMPPAVLPDVPSQYPGTHLPLLDGAPVIKDVVAMEDSNKKLVLERTQDGARSGTTTWRTILVQGFGANRGGYFALDVTDPVPDATHNPKFLWQLTTDATGKPLFGTRSGTPLITTLFFDPDGSGAREVPVAVLPGGDGPGPTGAKCNRADPTPTHVDTNYPPRSQINCYPAAAGPARSLTIVRLDTGEIIRTFRRSTADAPPGLAARVIASPLDSPITGTPVAFPGDTGSIADRVFVGDRDGTLWRVDLSSTKPDNWSMKLFFDPYSSASYSGTTTPFEAGQPIDTAPVLSLDDRNNVTVAFSTGDQDVLTAPPEMTNYVVSLTEQLDSTGAAYDSKANWYTTLAGGERVAGPITLFNGVLYFSTFQPTPAGSSAVCSAGTSKVWGVDYIIPKTASKLSDGGKERLPENPGAASLKYVQYIDNSSSLLSSNAVIFGVGVAQLPTCIDEASVTDPYFGTGSHTSVTSANPGKFQLVMETGNSGTSVPGGKSKVLTIDLPTPPSTPHIDSWAAITE